MLGVQSMPINLDNQQPQCDGIVGVPLDYTVVEQGEIPIFWGDNQRLRNSDGMYDFPSGMHKDSTLSVPKVGRFLYTFETDSGKIRDWDDAQADDCTGDGEPDGEGCRDNVDNFGSYVTIEWCYGAPIPFSEFPGYISGGSYLSPCRGDFWYVRTSPNPTIAPILNSCDARVILRGRRRPSPGAPFSEIFTYYDGPVRNYSPNPADFVTYQLPGLFGVNCCGDGGPPVPLPPPPPPPTDQTGCGHE